MFSLLRLLAVFACASGASGWSATAWPAPAAAERYVRVGLAQNLALQGQALDLAAARARLDVANSRRGPRLDLNARYSMADGGRTFDVPSGDLINPVNRALNEILTAQGRPAVFPVVSNFSIPFLREREQDTHLRLTAPVFDAELANWSAAKKHALESVTLQRAALRRDLRLGILGAYFGYLRARSAELILISATETTGEALRVSRVLLETDKVTEDRVLRAEADDLAVKQQLADAARDRSVAQHTFNVLLHQPLDTAVDEPGGDELAAVTALLTAAGIPDPVALDAREELAALKAAGAEAAAAEAAIRARTRPTFALLVDGGIQGESYRTGSGANYVQASVVGSLNLWDGQQRRGELEIARAQRRQVELRLEAVREQLALEARSATSELTAARAAFPAAQRRMAAAARVFQLVAAREREGLSNQLAFLDARQTHTAAQLNLEITRQRLFLAAARVDRALAATPVD